jgi:hypothetical protein
MEGTGGGQPRSRSARHAPCKSLHDTEEIMPERATVQRAKQKLRGGRRPSTAAGEFVREEMEHIREGKHGARSTKQAIAIGLSKARRAGVPLPPPRGGSARTRRSAERASEEGQQHPGRAPSRTRSRATTRALQREPRAAAAPRALASQAHDAAVRRGAQARSASARQAARTKGPGLRKAAARKAAATRKQR